MVKRLKLRAEAWFRKYIASVGWLLNAVCLFSALVILSNDVIFAERLEVYPLGTQLWDLVYKLSLALIASYVFFYINVHLRGLREKESLRPFLYHHTLLIVEDAEKLSELFGMATGLGVTSSKRSAAYEWELEKWPNDNLLPDSETAVRMCQSVDPNTTPPHYGEDWFEVLSVIRNETVESISRIYTVTPFLDPQYLKLAADVEDAARWLDVSPNPPPEKTLAFMSTAISEYFESIRRLRDYAYRHLTVTGSPESLRLY